MATLQSMALGGNPLNVTGGIHQQGGGCTPWSRSYHCGDCPSTSDCNPTYSGGYLHYRTPIPCEGYSMNLYSISHQIHMVDINDYALACKRLGVVALVGRG